jgi:hypothetical protein
MSSDVAVSGDHLCATIAAAAVAALVSGYGLGALVREYGLFSHIFTTAMDEPAATSAPVATVKRDTPEKREPGPRGLSGHF